MGNTLSLTSGPEKKYGKIPNEYLPPNSSYRDRGVITRAREEWEDLNFDKIQKTAAMALVFFAVAATFQVSVAYLLKLSIPKFAGSGMGTIVLGSLGLFTWCTVRDRLFEKDSMSIWEKVVFITAAIGVDILLFSSLFIPFSMPAFTGSLFSQILLSVPLIVYDQLFFGIA